MPNYHATSEGNVPFTAEEEAALLAEQTAWAAGANDRKAAEVRAERNDKLKDCDWTQISDSTANKAAWATYRQALRDVTSQPGFPWAITWPNP